METIERLESKVRSYSRTWPTVFTRSKGHQIWDKEGKAYIDFFSGAGSLNYGHNNPKMKAKLLEYIESDGITHSLDMATEPREQFLERFEEVILKPRDLDYVVQFPGPTGTNAVEAALKLARKYTDRLTVISFTNAFHGMTLGALAVTGNQMKRSGAGVPLSHTTSMPYENFLGDDVDTIEYLNTYLRAGSSGVSLPAAIIVETVQGEGGVNTASMEWLQRLEKVCRRYDILLILDDIQMGCGRTGNFFSFEEAGIKPDIVTLSKSISGYGLPMALTLFRRELDCWEPGEHNGTFRGNNPALITATETLDYWVTNEFSDSIKKKGDTIAAFLEDIVKKYPAAKARRRGRGMAQGIHCAVKDLGDEISHQAFERQLVIETSGTSGEVVKLLPALTIDDSALREGLEILEQSVVAALKAKGLDASPALASAAAG